MRLGILRADVDRPHIADQFGAYSDMFRRLLDSTNCGELSYEIFDSRNGQYPSHVDECDAYLITGSAESVFDDFEWIHQLRDYVIELAGHRKKTIGICFGHQMIASALGGEVTRAPQGWGVGVHSYEITDPQPWLQPVASSFSLLCSHQDQVTQAPTGAKVFARSKFCPIAALSIGDYFISFQGHPEFEKAYAEYLMRMREDEIGDSFDDALRSLSEFTDEKTVATWILNFLNR